jgi:diaminohydroxyphosphoribosylaminopyrimidine deaminase/5-amino-6-(5-phosphoribosylamino)uracil reductase
MHQARSAGLPGPVRCSVDDALALALRTAEAFVGAVAPNPPVGCVVLDAEGRVLAAEAHQRAGEAHAEARAIARCRELGIADRIDTVVVTLEPCNHHGRTPPCVDAILGTPARRVVIGATDPNPAVAGGGAARLARQGLDVLSAAQFDVATAAACDRLIAPFRKWSTTGRPWLTVKTAWTRDGSMIPPAGRTTFTRPSSLDLAHRLRRRADALITGSGTVLADRPQFTVRRVADHPGKRRHLVVLDRRGRVDADWLASATARGFDVMRAESLTDALDRLGRAGATEALLEAGPTLSGAALAGTDWDEHVAIRQALAPDGPDEVTVTLRRAA